MTTTLPESLDPKEVAFVQRSLRLFVALSDSRVARRAVRLANYSKAQHQRGVELRRRASGDEVPLPIDLGDLVPTNAKPYEVAIARLDDFENTWVPLTKTAVALTAPGSSALIERLFKGYEQAPRGADVVRTVKAWLAGWDALAQRQSEIDGADALRAELAATGLAEATIAAAREDIAAIEAGGDLSLEDPDQPRADALAQQREAFTKLKAWMHHWGLRFRQTMPHNDLVKMGLRQVANTKAKAEDDDTLIEDPPTPDQPPVPA